MDREKRAKLAAALLIIGVIIIVVVLHLIVYPSN